MKLAFFISYLCEYSKKSNEVKSCERFLVKEYLQFEYTQNSIWLYLKL